MVDNTARSLEEIEDNIYTLEDNYNLEDNKHIGIV